MKTLSTSTNRQKGLNAEKGRDSQERIELVKKALRDYRARYPEEGETIDRFEELVGQDHCFSKESYPAHFTGSAWILDLQRSQALLLDHPKFFKWLQPGGHLEEGELPWETAMREVLEETGLKIELADERKQWVIPFDLDRHYIPARKDKPEHWHYDFTFLVYASVESQVGGDEGLKLRWVDLREIHHPEFEVPLERMARKSHLLKTKLNS